MISRQIQRFIRLEAAAGVLLLIALFLALLIANTPWVHAYDAIIEMPVHIAFGVAKLEKPALLWVNEGFMAIFFLLLSLEIKREFLAGELSNRFQLALPLAGALGGILLPICIYVGMNHGHADQMRGWPIPTTTDVAFMLGIVALLGSRVPVALKVMLVALSIVDDILAIVLIAVVYSHDLSILSILVALFGFMCLVIFNLKNITRITPYVMMGVVIWVAVLQSGVHATLAGVLVGLTIPMQHKDNPQHSPLKHLEKRLHPWVAYGILPLFVFFNGGVPFGGLSLSTFFSAVPMGIAVGLFVGKTVGVFVSCWAAVKSRIAVLPEGVSFRQLLGVSALTGIGFTMSLFLCSLAFSHGPFENLSRQGVLFGSLLSCLFGVAVLSANPR